MRAEYLKNPEILDTWFIKKSVEKQIEKIIPKENKSYSIEKKIFNFQINQLLKPNKIPNHLKYYPQDVVNFVENIYWIKTPLNEENIDLNSYVKVDFPVFHIKATKELLEKDYLYKEIEINNIYEKSWEILLDGKFKLNLDSKKEHTKLFLKTKKVA